MFAADVKIADAVAVRPRRVWYLCRAGRLIVQAVGMVIHEGPKFLPLAAMLAVALPMMKCNERNLLLSGTIHFLERRYLRKVCN